MGPLDDLTYPEVCGTGDFDGDGLETLIGFQQWIKGQYWVALIPAHGDFNSSTRFFLGAFAEGVFCTGQ